MKKTAVDFIVEQLDVLHRERKENLIDAETFFKHKAVLIAESKEMEKQQAEKMYEDDMIRFMQYIISNPELANTGSVSKDTAKYYLDQFKNNI